VAREVRSTRAGLARLYEATSWNYTWFVPQDVAGLISLMGGDEKCIAKLDKMYAENSGLLANIPI